MSIRLSKKTVILIVIAIVIMVFAGLLIGMQAKVITVEGNTRYSDEEMKDYIFNSNLDENIAVLWLKNKFGNEKVIPFVEKYDIEIKSFNEVNIVVYEKSIVGYIDYMGTYMYFDKDGIVVESSTEKISDVPKITGIKFDYILLHEELPVENKAVFDLLLTVTQTLQKYDISVKKIYISDDLEITVYKENVKVYLGTDEDLSEKISVLRDLAPKLEGYSGTLDMSVLNTEGNGYTLKEDVQ